MNLQDSIKKRAFAVLLFLLAIIMMLYLDLYIPCIFHKVTGYYCPGCGITRMILAIMNFDFYQALCFILLPLIVPYALYMIYTWIFNKENKISKHIPNSILIFIVIILIIFGILRNIDAYDWLRPTIIH